MSAIAKPHLFFAAATAPQADVVIPVDWIYSMDKLDIKASTLNNNTPVYMIVVTLVPAIGSAVREEKIKFATQALRDTSFTNAKTLIAASIAGT